MRILLPMRRSRDIVPGMLEEDSEAHPLAPATGIIVGIGLSTMLWPFIILVVFWIR